MARLNKAVDKPLKTYGDIYSDLLTLQTIMTKVINYFEAKEDESKKINENERVHTTTPLFKSISEPYEDSVGHLIDLNCGHTPRPSDEEMLIFTEHLKRAGFLDHHGSIEKENSR